MSVRERCVRIEFWRLAPQHRVVAALRDHVVAALRGHVVAALCGRVVAA